MNQYDAFLVRFSCVFHRKSYQRDVLLLKCAREDRRGTTRQMRSMCSVLHLTHGPYIEDYELLSRELRDAFGFSYALPQNQTAADILPGKEA